MKPSLSTSPQYFSADCNVVATQQINCHPRKAIQVNAADPPAEQSTINPQCKSHRQRIQNGAQAKWFVTGTTNPGVTVNPPALRTVRN
jgi:hypothetical protein